MKILKRCLCLFIIGIIVFNSPVKTYANEEDLNKVKNEKVNSDSEKNEGDISINTFCPYCETESYTLCVGNSHSESGTHKYGLTGKTCKVTQIYCYGAEICVKCGRTLQTFGTHPCIQIHRSCSLKDREYGYVQCPMDIKCYE